MTKDFAKDVLSIPSLSGKEDMMIRFVQDFCDENGIECKEGTKGNLYLTKGSTKIYPCVTSHMDTVHNDQEEYYEDRAFLPIEEQGDRLFIDGSGVGADCKAGVAICLSIMKNAPVCKCALFVEEEIGMKGSAALDESFFDDVAYVIGFDSPEHNRATKACTGTLLYDNDFFEKYIKPVAASHGVTKFNYEPYTDVKNIRIKTKLTCMNFGNGGYNPHQKSEYAKFSEMCEAEALGLDLINAIPLDKRYTSEVQTHQPRPYYSDFYAPRQTSYSYSSSSSKPAIRLSDAPSYVDGHQTPAKEQRASSFWDFINARKKGLN